MLCLDFIFLCCSRECAPISLCKRRLVSCFPLISKILKTVGSLCLVLQLQVEGQVWYKLPQYGQSKVFQLFLTLNQISRNPILPLPLQLDCFQVSCNNWKNFSFSSHGFEESLERGISQNLPKDLRSMVKHKVKLQSVLSKFLNYMQHQSSTTIKSVKNINTKYRTIYLIPDFQNAYIQ